MWHLVEARPSRTKMMTPMQELSTWLPKEKWWKIFGGATDLKAGVKVGQCQVGESDVGEGGEGPGEGEVDDDADHPVGHAAHLLQDAALPDDRQIAVYHHCYSHLMAGVARLQRTISMRRKAKEAAAKTGAKNRHFTSFSQPTLISKYASNFAICNLVSSPCILDPGPCVVSLGRHWTQGQWQATWTL